jgi:hypothetical protein
MAVQPKPRRRGGIGGRGHLGVPSLLRRAAAGTLPSSSPTLIVPTSVIAVLLRVGPGTNDAQAVVADPSAI